MTNPYLGERETGIVIALVQRVQPKVMLEFGCNLGRTAKAILTNAPTLQCYLGIDVPYGHKMTLDCQISERPGHPGLYAEDDPRFELLLCDSRLLTVEDLPPCDAVFIDGDHSKDAVIHDSMLAREVLLPGGIIIWHDHGNQAVEVDAALAALDWPIEHVSETWLSFLTT